MFKRHYSAIVESLLAALILLLLFFGIMQIYRLALADMVSEYAAFRAARSASVGFDDYLVDREARVKTIPVSGDMIVPEPATSFSSVDDLYYAEKSYIESYLDGERWMEYEYWNGSLVRHNSYKCPDYGKPLYSGSCSVCNLKSVPGLSVDSTIRGDEAEVNVTFSNYPLNLPFYEYFSKDGTIDINKKVKLTNYAQLYLDE